jgi:hypothetical protein
LDVLALLLDVRPAGGLNFKELGEGKQARVRDFFDVISKAAPEKFKSCARAPAAERLGIRHAGLNGQCLLRMHRGRV